MPDDYSPDFTSVNVTDLLPDDPQARSRALVNALRGMNARANQEAVLTGQSEKLPDMLQAQAAQYATLQGQEADRQIRGIQALREAAQFQNQLRHQGVEEKNAATNIDNSETQREWERSHQAAEFANTQRQQLDTKVRELGKEMDPLHAVDVTLSQLEAELAKHKSLPGVGPVVGNVPPSMISDEGKKLRSLVETVGLQGDRVISGSTGFGKSPEMAAKLQGATQLLKTGTDEGIRQGVQLMRQLHDAAKDTTLQAYPEEVRQAYQGQRSRTSSGQPQGGAPTVLEERPSTKRKGVILQRMSDGTVREKTGG